MTHALRYTMSLVLGAMLAFGFLAGAQLVTIPAAQAQQGQADSGVGTFRSANDFLPDTFRDQTGLGTADLESTIGNLIKTVIRFLGIIAVIIVLYGGFRWMTASGNDDKVGEAKRILIAGLIGLAIVLTALAITTFVIDSILGATRA